MLKCRSVFIAKSCLFLVELQKVLTRNVGGYVFGLPTAALEWHLLAVFTFQIGYWSSLIRSRVVALPLASLSSGVRLAMVIIVVFFVFSFLTFLSQSSLSTVANSVFRCCSPFSSHAVQVCLNAVLPLACSVFLASFPSTFCVTGCHLPFFLAGPVHFKLLLTFSL